MIAVTNSQLVSYIDETNESLSNPFPRKSLNLNQSIQPQYNSKIKIKHNFKIKFMNNNNECAGVQRHYGLLRMFKVDCCFIS